MFDLRSNRGLSSDATVNERDILALVAAANPALPANILIAPGDDMALIRLASRDVLVAVDQVVEGRHFSSQTPLDLIARKAIARNVSDVAAMAALPAATLASVALPKSMSASDAASLLASVQKHAAAFGCPLIGGDTTVHADETGVLTLSVTILASPRADGIVVTRSGALSGDQLIVSGSLGGSLGKDGMGRHLTFDPRVAEAHTLVDLLGSEVHAMIDLSDGLGVDTARVIEASSATWQKRLQATLKREQIPCHTGVSVEHAVNDGEDYELLAAISARSTVPNGWTTIGTIREAKASDAPAVLLMSDNSVTDISHHGWIH